MKRTALACALLCLVLIICGCEETPEQPTTAKPLVEDSRVVGESERQSPDLPDEVPFICVNDDDSETLNVLADFSGEPLVLHIEDAVYELQHVVSGSGGRYESEGVAFWVKGDEATLAIRGGQYRCAVASD
ncbi:MAG: MliC family protein [Oceanidesulfovibrio sp.]